MAGHLLHSLFGSSPRLPQEVVAALGELELLAKERPEAAGPIAFLRAYLPAFSQAPILDPVPALSGDLARLKLADGVPLLRGEAMPVDVKAFRQRWLRICAAVQRHQGGTAAGLLAEAVRKRRLDPNALLEELLSGRAQAIPARAGALGLDPGLTATVLRLTLLPMLAHVNAALSCLRQGVRWAQGYCPTCGSWPLLGEFRGLEQRRFLRCGWCTAEWEFPRLVCVFCGTADHQQLGYLHVEGEESRYRAATCDGCRGYVKMLATLAALSGPQLLVAELATLHLDLAALARNYLPQA